ncbi:hypothetical protein ABT288_44835 [Streptomyces sp. NPDC001093]|uniref:hypothetical protein n=1 Tax=Streptomyces sp. NPDC001093 TaxID=3154376 RepID=UPI00332EBC5F
MIAAITRNELHPSSFWTRLEETGLFARVGGRRPLNESWARRYGGKRRAQQATTMPHQQPELLFLKQRAAPQLRPSLLRAVVQSVTMALCAAARVTFPEQTAVCNFVSTGSFLLLMPPPGL